LTSRRTLTINGQQNDDAVLCTADKTYALRSVTLSNSVLVVNANETSGEMVIRSQLNDILELVPSVPRLHRLGGLLKGMEYDENAADEDDSMEEDERRGTKRRRLTYDEVRGEIQASDVEFARGLKDRRILTIDGHLRPIAPSYLCTILELLLNYIVSLSLSVASAPVQELAATLADEHEIPKKVSTQVMSWFGTVHDHQTWSIDIDAILKEIGLGLLRSHKDEPIPETDFIRAWRSKVGDTFDSSISLSLLSGNYFVSQVDSIASDEPINLLNYYPASALPVEPAARFADLFLTRPRWRADDIAPFLADIAINSKERDKLLLKYARTTTDSQGVWYTARAQYTAG